MGLFVAASVTPSSSSIHALVMIEIKAGR